MKKEEGRNGIKEDEKELRERELNCNDNNLVFYLPLGFTL